MAERIGFYICHCGVNIAYRVRVDEVARHVATLPGVVVSRDYLFMCSDPGQELIETDIRDYSLTRVIVASCSPRMHEKTFRQACQRAGLNPFRAFHMVSVREQVSWVTEDDDAATRKASILAGAGVGRVIHQQALYPSTFPVCTNTLVVGGGIAGMQASLDIAGAGFKAYLVERQPTIGGHMLQYDKTFPTLDCAACIGTPKMVSVGQDPNIELLSYSDVTDVSGFIGNFNVTVQKKARYVKENCTGCGECASVCPVTRPNEWDVGTRLRKAIYRPFPQAVPITYCIEKYDRAPCTAACPAGTNIQAYVQLVRAKRYQEALNVIMERLPLPGVLGRVCPHPCESVCRRKEVDTAIAIRDLKRVAADLGDFSQVRWPEAAEKDQAVAVVGSGPAGLTVAYYLRRQGFQVTVFESREAAGGMLRWGIPDYRLPPAVLDREIDHILSTGIRLETGVAVGRDITIDDLRDQGYATIFLGIGSHVPLPLNIENDDLTGVVDAVRFLNNVNAGGSVPALGRVTVVGGGNVAMDAARAAVRMGADKVIVVYRRSRDEMPADPEEIEGALAEGVEFLYLAGPVAVVGDQGRVTGLACLENKLGPEDLSGRRRPVPREGSRFVLECDTVIPAIGQQTAALEISRASELALTSWGTFQVHPETMETSVPGIFAAGDAVTGPATVIEAVAAGHKAVAAIGQYLEHLKTGEAPVRDAGGSSEAGRQERSGEPAKAPGKNWLPIPEDVPRINRARSVLLPADTRIQGFEEVDPGLSREAALAEADRCLNCGGCCECLLCVEACEARAIDHEMTDTTETIEVGSIIVATGFDPMDPAPMRQYGYGRLANVFTNLEFERLSNATGPTGGKLLMRDPDNRMAYTRPPGSVAILHCIGSRDINHHEYCSRTCCMYALKYAHLLKDKCGHDTRVYNFYIDMRCFGKGYEEFFRRVQGEGVTMIRGKAAGVSEKDGMLEVTAEDTLSGSMVRVPVDMVILCTAMEPRADVSAVARTFGIATGGDGFFLEQHPKLEPVSTASSGVFLAGACQGPKDIPDTVAQAKGAAAEALALSARGNVSVSPMISFIDPDVCVGCQLCIGLCPYSAIEFNERARISVVNEAVCKGCGSCSGACPSGAAKVRHFTDKQVFAEIDGLMAGRGVA